MPQSHPLDYAPTDPPVRAAGEDRQGIRWGLSLAGGALGAGVAAVAVASAGLPADNPVGWLAIGCAVAIGAILGA